MSLWGSIKKGVKKVGDAVEDFVDDVGDAVGDSVEAVGDAVNDGLNWVGDKIGGKPFFSWLGGIIKGAFSILGAVVKGGFGIVGNVIGGVIKIIGGIITLQGGIILEGIWDIVSSVFGAVIVIVGKLIALIQSIFYAQAFERKLNEREKELLQKVFKNTLNYYVVRIIEGHAGIFGLNDRPFTLGNTIYMKSTTFTIDTIVHETTHVWQYQQTGDRYASDAIAAQWFTSDEYNWQKEVEDRNKNDWTEFNNEAQAEFFKDLWLDGELQDKAGTTIRSGNGSFFDADEESNFGNFEVAGNDYTKIANDAVKTVRNEWF